MVEFKIKFKNKNSETFQKLKENKITVISYNIEINYDTISKDDDNNRLDGKNIHTIGIENSYIRNEEDKPIAVIGLNNIVVVNTPDGILVTRKDISHRTGEIAKKIQENDK